MGEKGDLAFRPIAGRKEYNDELYDFIKAREGVRERVYTDSKGIPTIGVGYAFNKGEKQHEEDLKSAGINLTKEDKKLLDYVKKNAASFQELTAPELDARLMRDKGETFRFSLSDAKQARDLFNHVQTHFEDKLRSKFQGILGNREGGELYDRVKQTEESIPLFSLIYNTGTIGPKLTRALHNGKRVNAHHEICILYNKDGDRGIANRRYVEAERFGLFDDPNYHNDSDTFKMSRSEAEQLSDLWKTDSTRQKIEDYERRFPPTNAKKYDSSFGEDFNVFGHFNRKADELYGMSQQETPGAPGKPATGGSSTDTMTKVNEEAKSVVQKFFKALTGLGSSGDTNNDSGRGQEKVDWWEKPLSSSVGIPSSGPAVHETTPTAYAQAEKVSKTAVPEGSQQVEIAQAATSGGEGNGDSNRTKIPTAEDAFKSLAEIHPFLQVAMEPRKTLLTGGMRNAAQDQYPAARIVGRA